MTCVVAHVCLEEVLTPEYKMWAAELNLDDDFVPFTLLHQWEEGGVFQDANEEETLYDIIEEHFSKVFGYENAINDNGRRFIGDLTDETVTCCKRLYRLFGAQLAPLMRSRVLTDLGTYERPEIDVKVMPTFIAMSIKEYECEERADDEEGEREISSWVERRDVQDGRVRTGERELPRGRGDVNRDSVLGMALLHRPEPRNR